MSVGLRRRRHESISGGVHGRRRWITTTQLRRMMRMHGRARLHHRLYRRWTTRVHNRHTRISSSSYASRHRIHRRRVLLRLHSRWVLRVRSTHRSVHHGTSAVHRISSSVLRRHSVPHHRRLWMHHHAWGGITTHRGSWSTKTTTAARIKLRTRILHTDTTRISRRHGW